MYLNSLVKIPEARGKITFRTKGNTTYVEYESARVYVPEKKYTTVSRKTIGKLTDIDRQVMQPNENFLKFFPDTLLPEEKDRAQRSCALRIGTWIVIRKIVNDYTPGDTGQIYAGKGCWHAPGSLRLFDH